MAANGDKDDPKAYCAALMHETEKLDQRFAKKGHGFLVAKTDDAKRLVFGWASVSKDAAGNLLEDLQGDVIEPAELEKAVYEFVLDEGTANEMHRGRVKGRLVESMMVTPDKLAAMGLASVTAPKAAWWLGFKFDADAYARVKQGTYGMFSIEGESESEEIAA